METPKIIWSPKAKKQYSEVLLFWAENNNSVNMHFYSMKK